MNGKGSDRRPRQVSRGQFEANWEHTFRGGGEKHRKLTDELRDAWKRPHPGRAVPIR